VPAVAVAPDRIGAVVVVEPAVIEVPYPANLLVADRPPSRD
jgi:hypothetical protein